MWSIATRRFCSAKLGSAGCSYIRPYFDDNFILLSNAQVLVLISRESSRWKTVAGTPLFFQSRSIRTKVHGHEKKSEDKESEKKVGDDEAKDDVKYRGFQDIEFAYKLCEEGKTEEAIKEMEKTFNAFRKLRGLENIQKFDEEYFEKYQRYSLYLCGFFALGMPISAYWGFYFLSHVQSPILGGLLFLASGAYFYLMAIVTRRSYVGYKLFKMFSEFKKKQKGK